VKKPDSSSIEIEPLRTASQQIFLRGTSPFIFHRLGDKARRSLLMPLKMTRQQRAMQLKHDPVEEFGASVYRYQDNDHPTRLKFPASAFKQACATAALDLNGATKSAIGRLMWVQHEDVPIFGIPKLLISRVRLGDFRGTAEIRTRAIVGNWFTTIVVHYVEPQLNVQQIYNLFSAAGMVCGVGDWRQGKGNGAHGQFIPMDGKDFPKLTIGMGREEQDQALENPIGYDEGSQNLLDWFLDESDRQRKAGHAAFNREVSVNGR